MPFDDPGGGGLRGVSVAHGAFVVTNRHLRFEADDAEDVVWPVGDIRELVVVPEGLFIRALGRSTRRGVGAGPEWVALLPLLVEWASALHGDDLSTRSGRESAGWHRGPWRPDRRGPSGDRPFGWFADGKSAYAPRGPR